MQSVQARINNEKHDFHEFWRTSNMIPNRGNSSVPNIINGPVVISSSLDKPFAMSFV